jgi:hypothetical protein
LWGEGIITRGRHEGNPVVAALEGKNDGVTSLWAGSVDGVEVLVGDAGGELSTPF